MQNFLLFFIHKSLRSSMCNMCVILQYSDFASVESKDVVVRLADELRQWNFLCQCIENSLQVGLKQNHFLLSQIEAGNNTTRILFNEIVGDTERWIAANNAKQRLQIGAILCYRFFGFFSHLLGYMNGCEKLAVWALEPYGAAEVKAINRRLISCFSAEEWIGQTFQLLPAVSKKDRLLWLQYMQSYLPSPAWYLFANADDLFMNGSKANTNDQGKRVAWFANAFAQGEISCKNN